MLGVNFAGGNGAAVSDTECFSLPATGQCDLAADHHDARIPIMCVVGVHHPRLETTIEDLLTLASQFGFEFALVHDKSSRRQVRTKRADTPATSYRSGVLGECPAPAMQQRWDPDIAPSHRVGVSVRPISRTRRST
jgi:hypothetical protein